MQCQADLAEKCLKCAPEWLAEKVETCIVEQETHEKIEPQIFMVAID